MAKSVDSDSTITPPQENAALKWKKLTEPQQDTILGLPARAQADVKKLLKPAEGMEPVAEEVFDLLEGTPAIATALKLDLPSLRAQAAQRKDLIQYEGTTYKLYRRAAENRMAADSDIYAALLKVNRFVQGLGDAEISREFSDLTDWVSSSHHHGARDTKKDEAGSSDEKASTPPAAPSDVKP